MRRARDGVVLPAADHLDEVVLRTSTLSILAEEGHASWDPIRAGGEAAVERAEHDAEVAGLVAQVASGPGGETPAPFVWDASAPAVEVPARDSYAIRLVVGRALYDAGRAVSGSPLVAGLARPAELLVHPKDLQRLGVADGEEVRVTSSRTSLRLAVRSGPGVPVGVARRGRLLGRRHRCQRAGRPWRARGQRRAPGDVAVSLLALDPLYADGVDSSACAVVVVKVVAAFVLLLVS